MPHLTATSGDVAIIATTLALLDIERPGGADLADALGVDRPAEWPPEHNDAPYLDWQRQLLAEHPDAPGYAGWYVIGAGELVGTAGFKGPPDVTGKVEIGYSIVATRRRRGLASDAVELLVSRAFADERVTLIVAETLPALVASQAVLRRCGFLPIGTRVDPEDGEVLRFGRKR